ncbi:MAG: acyl carrier protein [Moorea sp. SIOASIH]|uniref:acyl carrier protein n=1 Tax=Moorena sp. SIOASIH TaxID=2607817 RepID=UPI0013B5D133|nr:acyl carrier protein [Moorena sp. SIOASIH]NEO41305.1 acyl carrier protein [Moorena sp. SIOASIH]
MEFQSSQLNDISTVSKNSNGNGKGDAPKKPPTAAEIQGWLVSYMAELLEIEPDEVDVTIPFDRYGLDSSAAVGLTGDLEDWLLTELDPTLMYDYPTIEALAKHVAIEA